MGAMPAALAELICALLAVGVGSGLEDAKRAAADGDLQGAVALVLDHLERTAGDAEAHELAGRWLLELGRLDESAHQLATSIDLLEAAGRERDSARLVGLLAQADRFATRRASFQESLVKDLSRAAEKLADTEQNARAEAMLERIRGLARGKERSRVEDLLAELRSAKEAVDLDEAGGEEVDAAVRPPVEIQAEHYQVVASLEAEVAELVAHTMDDIYRSYVQIYFDGDTKKTSLPRAEIRIHPSWEAMTAEFPGTPSPGLGGWWSAGENRVVCYDTRGRTQSLDEMLDTLFHEASHQFISMLASGSSVPSWLNEGTSCFFEGAVAMADHRVLWPDAALGRLQELSARLTQEGAGPSLADVVGYAGASSYPGEYYCFGWGLVYFLQQWEDPLTLEYSYRPLYARYRDLVIDRGGSRDAFDEVFLGKASPLGHDTFEDFERDWKRWILETVAPLHMGREETIRERRWQEARRYLAAAETASKQRKARFGEEELLERALGHVEILRQRAAPKGDFGRELYCTQIDVLERLDRGKAQAMTIEELLDFADAGEIPLEAAAYEELEARLAELDESNWALRNASSRTRGLETRALALLADYGADGDDLLLRSATFASECAQALASEGELASLGASLRSRAREKGLLLGRILALSSAPDRWQSVFTTNPASFEVGRGRLEVRSTAPVALLEPELLVRGEYELRARLSRGSFRASSSGWGLVVGGTSDTGAVAVGINGASSVAVWKIEKKGGGAISRQFQSLPLVPPLEPDEDPMLAIRVQPSGELEITVGERAPLHSRMPLELPPERQVGVFVRDATLVLEDPVVELW